MHPLSVCWILHAINLMKMTWKSKVNQFKTGIANVMHTQISHNPASTEWSFPKYICFVQPAHADRGSIIKELMSISS